MAGEQSGNLLRPIFEDSKHTPSVCVQVYIDLRHATENSNEHKKDGEMETPRAIFLAAYRMDG
jgi:hypothetical protein